MAPPKRGTLLRLQEYDHERFGISLVEVYERLWTLSFRSVKRPKRANRCVLITAVKETRKCSGFAIDSYLKDGAFTAVKRDARVKFLTGFVKGIPSFNTSCTKRMPFLSKLVYKRVQVACRIKRS